MTRFDASQASCHVYTFKQGLLSPVAHDLKLAVERFAIEVDGESHRLEGRFETASLRVECAMRDGREAPDLLNVRDRGKIEREIRERVLHADRHPVVGFAGTFSTAASEAVLIEGSLTLHGHTRPLQCHARPRDGGWVAITTLHQPDFGIEPYTAAFGTLRIRPDVEVRVSVPGFPLDKV
jgi:polyisoprenoid-binding protein YceI